MGQFMSHKPILLKKLAQDKGGRFREVIGLIGTHRGAGVTHTGLMLSFYFGEELGKKTAFLECNHHRDMGLIQNAYEWNNQGETGFSFHRITCFKEVEADRIPEILGEEYECIILDFGTDLTLQQEELLRCTTKIVVGGQSVWDIHKLKEFIMNAEKLRGSEHWLYYLPRADDRTIQRLKKEVKRRVWAVPEVHEPTRPNYNARLLIKQSLTSR